MATIQKNELFIRIAESTGETKTAVKTIIQCFLDGIIIELAKGNRLEFRDFGVFEVKQHKTRMARNPRTLEPVKVPPRKTVKFKAGRLMNQAIGNHRRS